MTKKKIEVVELNKDEEKIVLFEEQSKWRKFFKKYNKLVLLIMFILSISLLITGVLVYVSNLSSSDKMIIKEVSIDTDLNITNADVTADASTSMTDETAKKVFENSGIFNKNGEILLVKTVSKGQYTIMFYSDYSAVRFLKDSNIVTRIKSIDDKTYGISENGVTNSKAETLDITKVKTREYSFGIVTYYSDGSAMISDSDMDMYVRNGNDINKNYISNNRFSYLRDSDNIKGIKLNYYYDGTIEVIKNNKSYLVRDINDLNISSSDVTFKNDNEATIIDSVKLSDGKVINYYSDGGAIILDGNDSVSVRKSNSIIIKDNKIFEIVDNIYVLVSDNKNNGNVIYYTNGSAVIKNYNGKTLYVEDNSDIKYQNGKILSIGEHYEELTEERNIETDKILKFENIAVVETSKYIAIVPKNNVIYDSDGSLKEIINIEDVSADKPITITNNTNDILKYRIVIEKSNRTTLDAQYIKYQLAVLNDYIEPTRLDKNVWKQDVISNSLSVTGVNYILLERTLEPQESHSVRLMLWSDYDTIPNSMQNKYFYGTIRIYAWQEIKLNV